MTVVSTRKDVEGLTLTLVAEFDAGVERVWQVWEDPRQLERWWGPPGWPATVEQHDFVVGGWCRYHMTGPEGEKSRGWWTFTAIDAPHRLEFDDGFADENGDPVTTMDSMHMAITLEDVGGKTRMTSVMTFTSADQLEQLLEMGMEEGARQAMGQIDEVLVGA